MPTNTYRLDSGQEFGTWNDPVSRLMYHDCMTQFTEHLPHYATVADYGGANGLCRTWFPDSDYITVDIDPTKGADICADILAHVGRYDLILLRYVLHYLDDEEIQRLFAHISTYHRGDILLIQFVNENKNLAIKRQIAGMAGREDSRKHFRARAGLLRLLDPLSIKDVQSIDYEVDALFYRNRLGLEVDTLIHKESILSILCTP